LAALGIGTQFVGEELSEGEHVADAPVSHTDGKPVTAHSTTPAAPKNGHDPTPERPTEAHIGALRTLAVQESGTDVEAFETRIRRTMGLKSMALVAPKLLTRTMTMAQYMAVFEHYTRLAAQLARPTPEASAHEPQAPTTVAAEPAPVPAQETPAAVPSRAGFSSADRQSSPVSGKTGRFPWQGST
jgi:hypothetical protein